MKEIGRRVLERTTQGGILYPARGQPKPLDHAAVFESTESGIGGVVPRYLVNEAAVSKAEELIESRQYVVRSECSEVQPTADTENRFLEPSRPGGLRPLASRIDRGSGG